MTTMTVRERIAALIRKDVCWILKDVKLAYTERGVKEVVSAIIALEPDETALQRAAEAGRAARMESYGDSQSLDRRALDQAEYAGLKAALNELRRTA